MKTYVVLDTYFEDALVPSHSKGNTVKRLVVIDNKKTTVITPRRGHVFVSEDDFDLTECEEIKEVDIDEELIKKLLAASKQQKQLCEEVRDIIEEG